MEPQNNQMSEPIVVTTSKESLIAPLYKVTSLSKCLAAVVFIVMPFIGGFIGYSMGCDRH